MEILTELVKSIILIIIGIFIGLLLVNIIRDLAIKQQKKIDDKKLLGEKGDGNKKIKHNKN